MKSSKLFADFVVALNNDLQEAREKNPNFTEEDFVGVLDNIHKQIREELNEHGKAGQTFDSRCFGMVLDITGNYLFMDNVRLGYKLIKGEAELYDKLLLNRMDMVWAYFRQIIDSFHIARGLVTNATNRKADKGETAESSSTDQSE